MNREEKCTHFFKINEKYNFLNNKLSFIIMRYDKYDETHFMEKVLKNLAGR